MNSNILQEGLLVFVHLRSSSVEEEPSPTTLLLVNDTNLVFRLVEHFMWGAQSSQDILTGISKVDVPLQRPHFGVGHDTRTAGCTRDTKQDP